MSGADALSPRSAIIYCAMLAGAVLLFLFIDARGRRLDAPAPAEPVARVEAATGTRFDALGHVLLALMAVLAVGRLLGVLFRYAGQPPVIGEVLGGIALGPSVLGRLWPDAAAFVLPPSVAPQLEAVALLGVVLYMFLVGLELDPEALGGRARSAVAIAHCGIVVPFVTGAALALYLYPRLAGEGVPFTGFALFTGVAMSITAFPVLARILSDRRMQRTPVGVLALGCAAVGDVTAWCLLAFVVGLARSDPGGPFVVLGLTAAYVAFMIFVVRPVVARLAARPGAGRLTPNAFAAALGALLLSALATQAIGVHALFGAFLLGAVVPHDSPVARALTRRLEDLVTVLLLPAFFAFTGMRTRIDLVAGAGDWLALGLIVLAATAGKLGGTSGAARLAGIGWRDAAALGLLMNTRGLMELIVLNVGLDLHILSPALFAMMVLMALATTVAATPLLQLLGVGPPRPGGAEGLQPVGSAQAT